jgi:dihydroorotase-like cyclic amidohydrolase
MEIADNKRGLSPEEFCRLYPCGRSKLYELLAAGVIAAKKNGDLTVIPVEEAERWFASLPTFSENKGRHSAGRRRVAA